MSTLFGFGFVWLKNSFQGDALITTCDFRTLDRSNVTLGGFAISDEMCVNYIHYYPHTELEVCKSAISDQALQTFFRYMKESVAIYIAIYSTEMIVSGGKIRRRIKEPYRKITLR